MKQNRPDSYYTIITKPGLMNRLSEENIWKFLERLERIADDLLKPEFKFVRRYKPYDLSKLIENELCVVSHHSESWHIMLALFKVCAL